MDNFRNINFVQAIRAVFPIRQPPQMMGLKIPILRKFPKLAIHYMVECTLVPIGDHIWIVETKSNARSPSRAFLQR